VAAAILERLDLWNNDSENAMKHTSGPWKWDRDGTRGFPVLYGGMDGGHAILGLDPDGQRLYLSCDEPDARLIAAAPDLLEACRIALQHIDYLQGHAPEARGQNYRTIEEAIAKAEGRSD
jgi:hypothetical protein